MNDFQKYEKIMPTQLIDDPDLLMEYMEAALKSFSDVPRLQEQLQNALSREQDCRSTIADQASQIQKLTEKNGKLNESDLILQENEELKEKNEKLKQAEADTKKECSLKISDYKKQKDQKIREAEAEREKYESRHKQLGQEIEARARYIVKETTDALIKEAESKEKERELILAETKVNYLAWTAAPHFLNFLLVLFGLTVSSAYVSEWIRVGVWLKK